jgi:hypothetical protein
LASVADVTGIVTEGADGAAAEARGAADGAAVVPALATDVEPAAAKLLEDGGVAGVRPATATACGVDCAEGSAGVAERATADESSGALSCFHQAKRGADWQPVMATRAIHVNDRSAVRFMVVETRWFFALAIRLSRRCGRSCRHATTLRIFGMAGL